MCTREKTDAVKVKRGLYLLAGVVWGCMLLFFLAYQTGRWSLRNNAVTADGVSLPKTVTYNGQTWHYKKDLFVFLCMGIDTADDMVREGETGNARQSDANFLVVLDGKENEIKIVAIPRDTMTEIEIYDVGGAYVTTVEEHFALQFAYGDGGDKSCEMTMRAASRLFYGLPVNGYVCFNLRAIEVLNGMIGGVPVTPEETFEELNAGEQVTLNNEQAYRYVQSRDCDERFSAQKRLGRQRQYLTSFLQKALACTEEDPFLPVRIYHSVSDHMSTDIGGTRLLSALIAGLRCDFSESGFYVVPGEQRTGQRFEEYHVDEEAFYEMMLELFYVPQES